MNRLQNSVSVKRLSTDGIFLTDSTLEFVKYPQLLLFQYHLNFV